MPGPDADSDPTAAAAAAAAASGVGATVASAPPSQAEADAGGRLATLLRGAARLQRWVGVNYKPETEMQSHYGELLLSLCYDQVVYLDRTQALCALAAEGGAGLGPTGAAALASFLAEIYLR
jgi:erythromycin esterase-like protein